MYNKIIQLSDIHIHKSIERHNEYKQVFNNLYNKLDENCNTQSTLIIICGDLVHNKNDLHPNQITLLISLFKKLIKYGDVIIINGNHDINLSNSISSISIFSEFNNKIHFIDETGIYNFDNVDITVIDIKDLNNGYEQHINDPDSILNDIECNSDITNVLCIHKYIRDGMTNSYFNKNEYPVSKNLCSKEILPNYFDKFDIVCLGDIHHPQFLRKNIAYSGSLIQQNYGEHPNYHGFIEWDCNKSNIDGKFHLVYNDTGYFKLNVQEILKYTFKEICDTYFFNRKNLNIELCCEYDFMYSTELIEFKNNFKQYLLSNSYNLYSYTHILIQNDKYDLRLVNDKIDNVNMYYNETKLLDIQNEWIKTYYQSIQKEYCIEKMIELNKVIYENTHKDGTNKLQIHSAHFRFEQLKFKNVLCFETHYNDFFVINFTNGVIAIDGENYSGKSSILDILCFILFEETTRGKAKKQDIMNKNSKSFHIECILYKNNEKYCITYQCNRKEVKSKKSSKVTYNYPSTRKLYKFDECNQMIEINFETNGYSFLNEITFDDFIKSYVLIQNNLFGWLDDGPTERDKFLKKLCRWDDIDVQYKECLKILLEKEKEMKAIDKQKNDTYQIVQKYKSNLITIDYEQQLKSLEEQKVEYLLYLKEIEKSDYDIQNYDINSIRRKYNDTKIYYNKKLLEYEKSIKDCNEMTDIPNILIDDIEEYNNRFLQTKNEELEFLYQKCNTLKSHLKQIQDINIGDKMDNTGIEIDKYDENKYKECEKNYYNISNQKKEIQNIIETTKYQSLVREYKNTKSLCNQYFDMMKQWNECKKEFNKKCKYCCNLVNYNQYIEYEKEYNKNNELCNQFKLQLINIIPFDIVDSEDVLETINTTINNIYEEYSKCYREYTNMKILNDKQKQYAKYVEDIEQYKNWNKSVNECIYNVENEIQTRLNEKNTVYELYKKKYDIEKLVKKYEKELENYENIMKYEDNKIKYHEICKEYENVKLLCRRKYENENMFNVYNQSYTEYCEKYEEYKSNISEYECYKELFGVNGIPKWLYQKTIPKIEKLLNSWCEELKLDFKYEFSYVQNENMNTYLLDLGIIHNNSIHNVSHEIQLGSGLEKTITNILLRNAFDGLQNNRIDFFWIDETLSNMDQNHLQKLQKLFELLTKTFKSVFIISHQKEMYEFVDKIIRIDRKHNNRLISST